MSARLGCPSGSGSGSAWVWAVWAHCLGSIFHQLACSSACSGLPGLPLSFNWVHCLGLGLSIVTHCLVCSVCCQSGSSVCLLPFTSTCYTVWVHTNHCYWVQGSVWGLGSSGFAGLSGSGLLFVLPGLPASCWVGVRLAVWANTTACLSGLG